LRIIVRVVTAIIPDTFEPERIDIRQGIVEGISISVPGLVDSAD
jgi:hypothetical protein